MNILRSAALAALLAVFSPSLAFAHHGVIHDGCPTGQAFSVSDITVTGAFTRATAKGAKSAGGYLTVTNSGAVSDTLVGATSEAAADIGVHQMKMNGDVMEMSPVEGGLEIPAGGTVQLAPGGYHLMLTGMEQQFVEGACVEMTLHFAVAGDLPIQLNIGGMAQDTPPMAHDMSTMAMDAAPIKLGDLELSGPFSRATLPNAPVGAAYLTIANTGDSDDRLVSAASPVAGVVQLHEMKMVGDAMQMAELPNGIEIPAKGSVTLEPGGLHIMLMDLTQPLVEGTTVPVTLTFEKAGTIEVQFDVRAFAAKAAGNDAHAHGNGTDVGHADLPDAEAIAQMQKAMFDKPGSPLEMGPIVIAGEYAISDWAQAGAGGRALLRKTEKGWGIHLCAGAGLKDAANLAQIGVPPDTATALATDLAHAEASIRAAQLALYDSFDGTMMVDESLI